MTDPSAKSESVLLEETRNGVRFLRMNRPEKKNALSNELTAALVRGIEAAASDDEVRVVALTGEGGAFCSGADLQEIQNSSREDDAWTQWHGDAVLYKDLLHKMLLFPKPIIAAVNGPALGNGAGLVLASDIVIGTDLLEGPPDVGPPDPVGIVLEHRSIRGVDRVWQPDPAEHRAALVDGDGLDRRRPDVDPQRDLGHGSNLRHDDPDDAGAPGRVEPGRPLAISSTPGRMPRG